jgi:hypothetical protein
VRTWAQNFPHKWPLCLWKLAPSFSFFPLARLRKFGPQKKKTWTPGLLWGYWFRVWSPNPKTIFLHTEQVYIALEKSLHRQTEGQRVEGRAFAFVCGGLRLLKSGPVFSTRVPSFNRRLGGSCEFLLSVLWCVDCLTIIICFRFA